MSKKEVSVDIKANATRFNNVLRTAGQATQRFASTARAELARLKGAMSSVQGKMAALGLGVGMTKIVSDAGKLEKQMRLLEVSTGSSRNQMEGWRNDMLAHQRATAVSVEAQLEMSDSLQAVGLGIQEIRTVLGPATETMAVAKTNAEQLGKALGVANEQFGAEVDLKNQESVRKTLDQLLVAGRLGNAELEDLPMIFARVGGRAKEANMTMVQTLALTEALSQTEPQAERLSTLTDSTLRVFTNAKYMMEAQKGTGIKFFDKEGSRRDPLVVLADIKKKFDVLKTDAQRLMFIDKAFGKTDLDTQRGLKKLLEDGSLEKIKEFEKEIANAAGQSRKDLATATDNLPDQYSRLTAALRKSVDDGFARPFNDAISSGIKKLLDSKEEGGYGLSGTDIAVGGAGTAAAAYGMYRVGGPLMKKLIGKFGSTGANVATGKALEAAAGVTPVFVVNMDDGMMGGGGKGLPGAATGAGGGAATSGALGAVAPYAAIPLGFAAIGIGVSKTEGYKKSDLSKNTMVNTRFGRNFMSEARPGKGGLPTTLEDLERKNFYAPTPSKKAVPTSNTMINSRYGRGFMGDARGQSDEKIKAAAEQFERVNKTMLSEVQKTKFDGVITVNITGPGASTASVIGSSLGNLTFKTGSTTGGPK